MAEIIESKEQTKQLLGKLSAIFESWSPVNQHSQEAIVVFSRVIAATGATFQRMMTNKEAMSEVMDGELNVAQTCVVLMDATELSQRLARAQAMDEGQQATLVAAYNEFCREKQESSDQAYTMFLKIMDASQMKALIALYGPSFV